MGLFTNRMRHLGGPQGRLKASPWPVVTYNPATYPPLLLESGWPRPSAATIYVLNGPNLNLLGTREPETYGHATLADVEKLCVETAAQFGLNADCRQSNREGELIDFIHEAARKRRSASSLTPAAIRTPRSRCMTRWSR